MLRATATYKDGFGEDTATKESVEVNEDTRNRAPVFVDQDTETEGKQNETATREVEENTKALAGADDDDDAAADDNAADNVGSAVMAEDPDPNMELLIYTLSGTTDAGPFRVRNNGQIEVAAGAKLDYETKQTYMVTLKAEDSFGASASIMVTITVTDMDEVPDVSGDATKEYAENGTGQVARYTAIDPEQTAIVSWTLDDGADASLFSIEGGALTFKKAPNYEMAGTDNMYEVTVQATDSTMKMGTKAVMVEVTNVEEPGKVTLSALRPQSATPFTATLTDPDGPTPITTGVTWQWAKAGSKNGTYRNIEDETSSSYEPVDGDIDSYLRATASYTDGEGSDKSAMMVSDYAVQSRRGANMAPAFPDDIATTVVDEGAPTREVPENTKAGMAIGDPVVAEDKDINPVEVLTYTLGGTDAEFFAIDRATGQIMTKDVGALDAERQEGPTYTVTVRATDPAGVPQIVTADTANSDTVDVTITVTNVNEPPAVTGDDPEDFAETDDIIAVLVTYAESNPEDDVTSVW